jgi:tetratricopeptide (TPR) repeat protein
MGMKKAFFIPAVVLVLALAMPSPAQTRRTYTAQPPADPLQDAEALLEKEQYAQAEEKLRSLMPAQAKNPQAWFDLGFALSHQEKAKDAIAPFQKAVALSPDWFEANLNLGIILAKSGDPDAAVPVLKHAVTLKPTSGGQKALGRAWIALGQALENSDPKSAVAAYDKAADMDPADQDLLVTSGFALERTGDLAGAEQRYTRAAGAGNSSGLSHLISLLRKQHRDSEALVWLNKYVGQNPQDADARVQLASALLSQGKREEAIAMLETAQSTLADPRINRALASLYLDAKQYDKAAASLQQLVKTNPGDAQLRWDLGSALIHLHKYPEAESEMLGALKTDPTLASDPWELAFAAQQNKHYELAIRILDTRSRRFQETPTTYWIRAVSYDSLGAAKPAAANYRLFLASDEGKSPEQEFQARHRLKAIAPQ